MVVRTLGQRTDTAIFRCTKRRGSRFPEQDFRFPISPQSRIASAKGCCIARRASYHNRPGVEADHGYEVTQKFQARGRAHFQQ
jgi:hypothetical protein